MKKLLAKIPPAHRRIVAILLALGIAITICARQYQSGADFPRLLLGSLVAPYPSAPLCAAHDNSEYHALWNEQEGCHYNHEHGDDPFTPEVAAVFTNYDLAALQGSEIGHASPSSPAENTIKHGGFKYTVVLNQPCESFEGADWCVTDAVVQTHTFGDNAVELDARFHSMTALVKVRDPNNLVRSSIMFFTMLLDLGQRVTPYQGAVLAYPDTPSPAYSSPLGPYWSLDPFGTCTGCRPSPAWVCQNNANNNETITSKGRRTGGQTLVNVLARVRDASKLLNWSDQTHPFTFAPVCSGTGPNRYNNSTVRAHEIAGTVPAAWDNLAGWDSDTQVGRVSIDGQVTAAGQPIGFCPPGQTCYPVKWTRAFVGTWGGNLCPIAKCSNTTPVTNPEHDVYFCGGVVCAETAPGAVPSGWIGPFN